MKVTLGSIMGGLMSGIAFGLLTQSLLGALIFAVAYFVVSTVSKHLYANYKAKKVESHG